MASESAGTSERSAHRRVALFVTCIVDALHPDIGLASAEVLERQGLEVVVPQGQTCCGQPAFNAGYRVEALSMARQHLETFAPLLEDGRVEAIVAPSGSCVAMVRHFHSLLFERSPERDRRRVARLASATYELTQYLVDVLGVKATGAAYRGRLTYHPCCHLLRDLGVDAQPRQLLKSLRGSELVDLPNGDECCGFGGLFAIKNAALSTAMGRRKARALAASGARVVALNDASCMTHINGILRRERVDCRAVHIARLVRPADEPLQAGDDDAS